MMILTCVPTAPVDPSESENSLNDGVTIVLTVNIDGPDLS